MARSGRPARPTQPRKTSSSSRKANAEGFAKRQSRKASNPSGPTFSGDIYEHIQHTGRRSRTNVSTRLAKDEAEEFGVRGSDDGDSEGEDNLREGLTRARLVGEEGVDSGDDEEIDSDEAFGEEDEERFSGFKFASDQKATKPKARKAAESGPSRAVRFAEVDLNENDDSNDGSEPAPAFGRESDEHGESDYEEDEDEEDDEDMVDLVDILDGKAQPYYAHDSDEDNASDDAVRSKTKELARLPPPGLSAEDASRESDEDEGMASDRSDDVMPEGLEDGEDADEDDASPSGSDEEVAVEDADSILASDDNEDAEGGALDGLSAFISTLDTGAKRKADEVGMENVTGEVVEQRPRKRRFVQDRTEVGAENEFAARLPAGSQKLNLEDLLAPLASQPSSNLVALKKSTKALSSNKAGALSAPLPMRTQERLDREAAYERTKDEVDKWSATMKHIKEAEHLSFPLQAEKPSRASNLELAAKFKPSNELESAVDRLLKAAQMREQDLQQTEELKMNHLSPEEVQERRAELRRMRELTFRADAKAKRIAKIKSKTFRKIRNKQKAKISAVLGEDDDDDADDEEARMKREVERAKERATLRHKNTGKWACAMKARGELDEEQREDVAAMLDRGDKLRRRIRGEASGDERSDDSSGDEDADEDAIRARAFEEVQRLKDGEEEDTLPGAKSVFQMKFMRDAMARDTQRADQLADDFVKEMGHSPGDEEEDGSSQEQPDGLAVQRTGGRMVFRPGVPVAGLRQLTSLASDTSSVTLKSSDLPNVSPPDDRSFSPAALRVTPPPVSISSMKPPPVNPWLVARDDAGPSKAVRKKNEVVVSKESNALEKSKNKLRKQARKREEERELAREDAELEILVDDVLTLSTTGDTISQKSIKVKQKQKAGARAQANGDESDAGSEIEEQEKVLAAKNKKGGMKAFQQRDLVARAFAGDNVVRDFEEAKRREMTADAPKEVDTTLAGWGSWGGVGLQKPKPKPHLVKQVAGVDPRTRADYGKSHVIISERRDKKAAKYLVKDLPHPYTSKAQFERSIDTPLGAEWNTRVGFQRGTLPRVVKKPGAIISPLEKLV